MYNKKNTNERRGRFMKFGVGSKSAEQDNQMIYQLDGRPRLRAAIPLGLQHILAMFVGNLAPIFILTGALSSGGAKFPTDLRILMIQCAMLVSGLVTLVQLYPIKLGIIRIGARLPIVVGTAFAFVPTMQALGLKLVQQNVSPTAAMSYILGGVIAGSVVEIILGLFLKYLSRFFPPLVIGSVLVTIGISLLSTGAEYFVGGAGTPDAGAGKYWAVGGLVFLITVLLNRYAKGMLKAISLLIGIIVGYVVALSIGMVDFTEVSKAAWFSVPLPLDSRILPMFRFDVILPIAAIYVVSALETLGNTGGITIAAFEREATPEENGGAIMADGVGSLFAGLFNVLPNTAFGQNAGIVAMTKVVNRFCIAMGALFLVLAALVPKIGAIFNAMPSCVMGGAVITVFAMIFLNGIKMIQSAGFNDRNNLIIAITFGLGYGISSLGADVKARFPLVFRYLFEDPVAAVCIVSVIACIVFPVMKHELAHEKT